MAKEKESKIDKKEVKEVKKLGEFRHNKENKKAIAESDDKIETKKVVGSSADSKLQSKGTKESVPAVEKKIKVKKDTEKGVVELEREYIVPLKKGVLNVPHYRRAKKAIRILKEFMVKHMKVRDRDLKKVKINMYLNNELWFRGIKKPANKIKVKAKKIDGIVYVELADVPEAVGYKMAWAEKRKSEAVVGKVKAPKQEKKVVEGDKDKDGVDDKVEEKETKKAGAERDAKAGKVAVKKVKHTVQGKHAKKTMPVRKVLK